MAAFIRSAAFGAVASIAVAAFVFLLAPKTHFVTMYLAPGLAVGGSLSQAALIPTRLVYSLVPEGGPNAFLLIVVVCSFFFWSVAFAVAYRYLVRRKEGTPRKRGPTSLTSDASPCASRGAMDPLRADAMHTILILTLMAAVQPIVAPIRPCPVVVDVVDPGWAPLPGITVTLRDERTRTDRPRSPMKPARRDSLFKPAPMTVVDLPFPRTTRSSKW